MATNGIQVVCFDLGGVLIRICRSWKEAAGKAGLPLRDGVEGLLEGSFAERRRLVYEFQTGRMDIDPYFEQMSVALERLYAPEEIRAVHDAWMYDEYEGLTPLLDSIHDAGLATACLSNINPIHWALVLEFPIVKMLGRRFASHLIGHHKPDEDIYRHAERELDVDGAAILFFDDLEENVLAARELGWFAVHIDHAAPTAVQMIAALHEHGIVSCEAATRR